ncbi:5-dehydro-4-deoxy-D-glucuronate isomerase [Agromyces mariniharenae]|uniref:5-dehydro-4-deoxy-D-glucuronate isomerase n=2 Tax=Agromyces mariniharenae TaxID=2604423 RepID=A0A5S4V9A0_9MICO|nr:5-dehydro-4-deoxy-D-glucuronate isomerase [Agromyces mariniharenae]
MDIDRPAMDAQRARAATTQELRDAFLVEGLFREGEVSTLHTAEDRMLIAGVVPSGSALELSEIEALGPDGLSRREFGIVNVGGPGVVVVDGERFELAPRDGLYAGRGSSLSFEGAGARFYVVGALAHTRLPAARIAFDETEPVELGDEAGAGRRRLYRYIWGGGTVESCQLQLGVTVLEPGAVWNTFPPHLHARRTEIYLYFELPGAGRVVHLMGEPEHTRHLIVANEQAVIAPRWSIHSGAGTARYSFVWAMAGDNRDYGDLAPVPVEDLR